MFALLLATALAAEPALDPSYALDAYAFTLKTCDSVRAEVIDTRPADQPRSPSVIIELTNQTAEPCAYVGVALKGWLSGVYSAIRQNPDNTGFTLPAGESIRLRVIPTDPSLPRKGVQLQIPPEKGLIILIGLDPSAEAKPTTPTTTTPSVVPTAVPATQPAPPPEEPGKGRSKPK